MNKKAIISILGQFSEIYDHHEALLKLMSKEILNEYSCSELHCIDAIGKIENANVTKIANQLKMTRGAISKITKKQIAKGLINSYQLDNNKKEIYFKLTDEGKVIFQEHEKRHMEWEKRSAFFFDKYSQDELDVVLEFLQTYDLYVKNKIDTLNE